MVTKWYKSILKHLLYATQIENVATVGSNPNNEIKNTSGNFVNPNYINFGYSASYVGFPIKVYYNISSSSTSPGFVFQRQGTPLVESDENYVVNSSYIPSYLSINSLKAVKRYDAETNSPCIDYYIELKNTGSSTITLVGVGFNQYLTRGNGPSSTTANSYETILFDYTEFPEPVAVTTLRNETIVYTIKTTWDFEEEEEEPEPEP